MIWRIRKQRARTVLFVPGVVEVFVDVVQADVRPSGSMSQNHCHLNFLRSLVVRSSRRVWQSVFVSRGVYSDASQMFTDSAIMAKPRSWPYLTQSACLVSNKGEAFSAHRNQHLQPFPPAI
jgi:hypothetical protein